MTSKPELQPLSKTVPGLAALALFAIFAVVFLGASFPEPAGFEGIESITAAIGYSMFNIGQAEVLGETGTEFFLVAFEIIDMVLVAALVAAVMLARRESLGEVVSALRGGEQ